VYVSEYPAIQHRHENGDVVTVRLTPDNFKGYLQNR